MVLDQGLFPSNHPVSAKSEPERKMSTSVLCARESGESHHQNSWCTAPEAVQKNSRCEVSCGCGCFSGVCVQSGSPDSTFVTQKRSYPVPCVSLAQHGLAIFAGANEEVSVGSDSTESQVHHGSGVTRTGERGLSHRHGPPAGHEMVLTEGGNGKGKANC